LIHRKTAQLFQAGAEVAAGGGRRAAGRAAGPGALWQAPRHGLQLIDDVLDYRSDPETRGKNLGDDLAEGKPTLPLIHALRRADPRTVSLIRTPSRAAAASSSAPSSPQLNRLGPFSTLPRLGRPRAIWHCHPRGTAETPFRNGLAALARFAVEASMSG